MFETRNNDTAEIENEFEEALNLSEAATQTEYTMEQLALLAEEKQPRLAKFIKPCRYGEDLGESSHDKGILKDIVQEADELFGKIGLQCKGWTFEGEEPPENTVKSGSTLTITGQRWIPKVGGLEVPIPQLYFGTQRRGRVDSKVIRFPDNGSLVDMEKFIPKLTRTLGNALAGVPEGEDVDVSAQVENPENVTP